MRRSGTARRWTAENGFPSALLGGRNRSALLSRFRHSLSCGLEPYLGMSAVAERFLSRSTTAAQHRPTLTWQDISVGVAQFDGSVENVRSIRPYFNRNVCHGSLLQLISGDLVIPDVRERSL